MTAAEEAGAAERRRRTKENLAVRRMIDVLGWAANLPAARFEDARCTIADTRESAVVALRRVAR
jgi:hypothetical protein